MIAESVVVEIRRLLAEGVLSQREIARRMGISRGIVLGIASGRRPDYETLREKDAEEEPAGPPVRCTGCGGMVFMPCRLCGVRRRVANDPRLAARTRLRRASERLELNLRPEHRVRFEEVWAWRRENRAIPLDD